MYCYTLMFCLLLKQLMLLCIIQSIHQTPLLHNVMAGAEKCYKIPDTDMVRFQPWDSVFNCLVMHCTFTHKLVTFEFQNVLVKKPNLQLQLTMQLQPQLCGSLSSQQKLPTLYCVSSYIITGQFESYCKWFSNFTTTQILLKSQQRELLYCPK